MKKQVIILYSLCVLSILFFSGCGAGEGEAARRNCIAVDQDGNCVYAPTCSNDCSPNGATQCSGDNVQTCGNWDSDSCREWGNDAVCPNGCNNGECLPLDYDFKIERQDDQTDVKIERIADEVRQALIKGTDQRSEILSRVATMEGLHRSRQE